MRRRALPAAPSPSPVGEGRGGAHICTCTHEAAELQYKAAELRSKPFGHAKV